VIFVALNLAVLIELCKFQNIGQANVKGYTVFTEKKKQEIFQRDMIKSLTWDVNFVNNTSFIYF